MNEFWRPVRRPEIAWRVIEGEAVVVDPRAGMAFPFNPVATRCWEMTDGTKTVAEMIAIIAEEFDAPFEQIQHDVRAFLEDLAAKGLLEADSANAAGACNGRV